jgi:hypothetical protein
MIGPQSGIPDTRGIAAAGGYPGAARTERHPEHPRAVGNRELLLASGSIPDRRSPCPGQRRVDPYPSLGVLSLLAQAGRYAGSLLYLRAILTKLG